MDLAGSEEEKKWAAAFLVAGESSWRDREMLGGERLPPSADPGELPEREA